MPKVHAYNHEEKYPTFSFILVDDYPIRANDTSVVEITDEEWQMVLQYQELGKTLMELADRKVAEANARWQEHIRKK